MAKTDVVGLASPKRPPRRKNGQRRLKALIDATDTLLQEYDVGQISLNKIAESAGVPPASVYHFFPSKEAALIELAEVYFGKILESSRGPIAPPPATWQDLIVRRLHDTSQFFNEHPSSMKLFFGTALNAEVRRRDMDGIASVAEARADAFDHYFVMPSIPDWTAKLANSVALNDGIWALAYSQHRCITAEALEEGIRATIAYLRCFLPEYLAPKMASSAP